MVGLGEVGTLGTAEAGEGDGLAGKGSGALVAGLGALGPGTECGEFAVNRASLLVASNNALQVFRAGFAAEVGIDIDVADLRLGASTASLGAVTNHVVGPFGDHAIDRAGLHVAHLGAGSAAAGLAAECGVNSDLAGRCLLATAALVSANRPGAVLGEDAVDRASGAVAGVSLGEDAARLAAVLGSSDLRASAGADASGAARLGAGRHGTPPGGSAIDGAGLGVARRSLGEDTT